MMTIRLLLCAVLLLLQFQGFSQEKYWVFFTDKGNNTELNPTTFLTQEALDNRQRQGIRVDFHDYPVSEEYVDQLKQAGIMIGWTSKWFNAVSAVLDPEQKATLSTLSFIRDIRPVGTYQQVLGREVDCSEVGPIDTFTRQLTMVGLDELHVRAYTGRGVRVAVFDSGFKGAEALEAFQHIFDEDRLIATRNYVQPGLSVLGDCQGSCRHGTYVWSILAGDLEGQIRGSAPGADFILLRTENDTSETHQEEDNWVAAAEFADSLGAQIFTTSLGYFNFDPGEGSYTREDMDGNTAIITRAADMAASRGILVINSGGNAGARGPNAPADADSVLAIGAVNQCEEYSSFSSQGPTADGRIKPDITAMGEAVFFVNPAGGISRGNGTSFSAPIVSGLAACLMQAAPHASAREVYEALIRSADRYETPDNLYGHGIPKGPAALSMLALPDLQGAEGQLFPNPNEGRFTLVLAGQAEAVPIQIELTDMAGRRVWKQESIGGIDTTPFAISPGLPTGLYILQVIDTQAKQRLYQDKVLIRRTP